MRDVSARKFCRSRQNDAAQLTSKSNNNNSETKLRTYTHTHTTTTETTMRYASVIAVNYCCCCCSTHCCCCRCVLYIEFGHSWCCCSFGMCVWLPAYVCVSVEPRLLFTMSLKGNKSNKIAHHWSEQSCKTCFCFVVVVVSALKMRSLFLLPVVILLSFFNSNISSIYYTIS